MNEIDAIKARLDRLETHETTGVWVDYTPTFTGFSADPAGGIYRHFRTGKLCAVFIRQPNAGTSDATTFTISAPFTSANILNMLWMGSAQVTDNGTTLAASGLIQISPNTAIFNVYAAFGGAGVAWTASGNKRCNQAFIVYETA